MSNLFRVGLENAAAASLLAIIAFAASRFLKRSPALVHAFLLLVLLKLVTPPLWSFPVFLGLSASEPEASAIIEARPVGIEFASAGLTWAEPAAIEFETVELASLDSDRAVDMESEPDAALALSGEAEPLEAAVSPLATVSAGQVLAGIWLSGSGVMLVFSILAIRRFVRVLALAKPASSSVEVRVEEAAASIGLSQVPETFLIDWDRPPMVWALGRRPSLMIPTALWSRLDSGQRDTLLIHELAHLKRGDHLVRWLELAVSVIFWWLPVVWWTRGALRETEEDCCDAWVIWALPKSARCYADTLVETVDFLSESRTQAPLLASGFGHVRQLKRRLKMIMQGNTTRRLRLREALAVLAMGAAFLPLNPSWADPQDAPKPAEPTATTSVVEYKEAPFQKEGKTTVTRTITTTSDADGDGDEDVEITTIVEPAPPATPASPAALVAPTAPEAPVVTVAPVAPVPPVLSTPLAATNLEISLRPDGRTVATTRRSPDDVISSTVKSLKNQLKQLTGNPDLDPKSKERSVKAIKQAIEALQGALPEPKESRNESRSDNKRARVVVGRRLDRAEASTPGAKDIAPDGDLKVIEGDVEIITENIVGPEEGGIADEVLNQQIRTLKEKLKDAQRLSRDKETDPTIRHLQERLNQLTSRLDHGNARRQLVLKLPEADKLKHQEARLSAMEKTLAKVLEELKSLKKEKSN